jgi:hypothetical protein
MLDRQFAEDFGRHWIDAWNAHDLNRVLAHYSEDFEMTSPLVAQVVGVRSCQLRGKSMVGNSWRRALERVPDLNFRLTGCFAGVDSVVLCYETSLGRQAAETFFFNVDRLVERAAAHYA